MEHFKWQEKSWLSWMTLFVSSGTLLCCAFPILLTALGFGAFIASLYYSIPALVFFAEHKFWILGFSSFLLILLAWVIWRPNQYCPIDPELAQKCQKAKRWNQWLFGFSVAIWLMGLFFSVLLLPLRQLLGL